MARYISEAQLRQQLRQIEEQRRQAFNKMNQAIRNRNQAVNQAINKYNQEARAHNSRVIANRQRIATALASLQNQIRNSRYPAFRSSVTILHRSYITLEGHRAENRQLDPRQVEILDLTSQEAANSLDVMNALLGNAQTSAPDPNKLLNNLGDELVKIAPDLDARWKGALFALNPNNPDAARHFCSSSREIFSQVINFGIDDSEVIRLLPDCEMTKEGKPTRRTKIQYHLCLKTMNDRAMTQFVEDDIGNILELFAVLNAGTHGSAGKFDFPQLCSIKTRVEDGIRFLSKITG